MSKYDKIEIVEKHIEEIEVVEKFNPFHDSQGKFSSSNGFASYSANPNTKAGAMAIARSAAAGHMNTKNVHREAQATGTTIRQNANWLGRGKQATPGQQGATTLNRRVEPIGGLMGASATGASWQHQNAMQGRTTSPGKAPTKQTQQQTTKPAPQKQTQTQPTQQKPTQQQQQAQQQPKTPTTKQTLADQVNDVQLRSGDKLAIQARDGRGLTTTNVKNVAKPHDQERVAGKDISGSVDVTKIRGSEAPIDKIAKAQGWNKAPTVTDDLETFQKAAKKSGCVMMRSVHDSYGETADQVCKKTMTNGNASLGGNGGQCYGSGMYMVKTDFQGATGRSLGQRVASGQKESYYYGDKQMMATLHSNAKIATPTQSSMMESAYNRLPSYTQRKYGDIGGYIASKGYDGAQWHNSSDPGAYCTVYNKSALIFYSGVATQ